MMSWQPFKKMVPNPTPNLEEDERNSQKSPKIFFNKSYN